MNFKESVAWHETTTAYSNNNCSDYGIFTIVTIVIMECPALRDGSVGVSVRWAERQKNTDGCRCPSVNIPRGSQGNTAPWLGPVPERTARTRRRWVSNICPRTPAVCPNRSKPGEQTSAFPCRCWRLTLPASARSIEHSTVCVCVSS